MRKIVIVAALVFAGSSSVALADVGGGRSVYHRHHAASVVSRNPRRVAANGRCGGISYGTGARSCGTATGGPVGGLSNRN